MRSPFKCGSTASRKLNPPSLSAEHACTPVHVCLPFGYDRQANRLIMDVATPSKLEKTLSRLRPAVRAQKPYIVGLPPNVHVKLNQNESPYDLPAELREELIEAFWQIPANRYPSEQPEALCAALAQYEGIDQACFLVGNGSNELTYLLGLTMISEETPVVLPTPMFSLYTKVVGLHDGQLIAVPPRTDLSFDTEAILDAVKRFDPALTVLTTPNNPTGLAMPIEEIRAIADAANGYVVVDEAYAEFNNQPSAKTLLASHPNVLVMRTLSKAFGLAGMRLGYLIGHAEVIAELMKARLPFMIDRFSEATALALLNRQSLLTERVNAMKAGIRFLTSALAAMENVTVVPSLTNFVLFKPPVEPALLLERLAAHGVLVRNMGGYPELKGFLRVNTGTEPENQAFLTALNALLPDVDV